MTPTNSPSQGGETKKPLNIILLGDPAAGKATQAAYLTKKFKFYDLDMGHELRRIKKQGLRSKYKLQSTLDKGKLTPTEIVRKILHHKIKTAPKHIGILFDGTPKMIGEAKLVYKWLKQEKRKDPIVIYLSIPLKETIKRMSNRIEYFKGKYSKRADDNDQALKNRVRYYRENIAHVVKFFRSKYAYKKISGLGTKAAVKKHILHFIKNKTS